MKPYLAYRDTLDRLLQAADWGNRRTGLAEQLHASLNGGAAGALRSTVAETTIHRNGAYFTGEDLGRQTVRPLARNPVLRKLPVCDPTCGSGDLLLRWAEFLPVNRDLGDTLEEWETLLHGIDLHQEFLSVAKRRLALMAISRGARHRGLAKLPLDRFFPGLVVDNILRSQDQLPGHGTLIMNPPFTHGSAPRDCSWATGRVSHAALAFAKCLTAAAPGQRIVAILPDVLRSGRRYEHWRKEVAQSLTHVRVEIVGRFDDHADVDVFLLRGTVGRPEKPGINWLARVSTGGATLDSISEVHVGPVVPHRDDHTGPWRRYVTVDDLPPWEEISTGLPTRRHWNEGVRPPFVAVRRTSSPTDTERAIGTVVRGAKPVVAENHVITVKPADGRLASCQRILRILRDKRTRAWLNRRIRCRHLTVGAIREIPLLA